MSEVKESQPDRFVGLLASKHKEEVLKQLLDNQDYTFTVNEIAENVSASYNTVSKFLRQLERFEIVDFQKKGGSYLVEYNQESRYHEIIKDLLKADNQPLEEAAREYAEKLFNDYDLKDQLKSIYLFGSVARETAKPESDIDILVIASEDANTERVETKARNYAEKQVEIENDVVPVVETDKEFRENFSQGKRFEENLVKDGVLLQGEELDVKS